MRNIWEVREEGEEYSVKLQRYSSIFINYTSNEQKMLNNLIGYFQPRTKLKNKIKVLDKQDEFASLASQSYQIIQLSHNQIEEEIKLGNRSFLKDKVMNDIARDIEADGYLMTVNTLLEDFIDSLDIELPLKYQKINFKSLLKFLKVDVDNINEKENENYYLQQNKVLIPILMDHFKEKINTPIIIFYLFPETNLSFREQIQMKGLLTEVTKDFPVIVLTKSKIFLSDDYDGINYYNGRVQMFTEELIEELEWNSPINFTSDKLELSVLKIVKRYVDLFEINPTISNYTDADIILFDSIDLFVLTFILNRLRFKFRLDLDDANIDAPVFQYLMKNYENIS